MTVTRSFYVCVCVPGPGDVTQEASRYVTVSEGSHGEGRTGVSEGRSGKWCKEPHTAGTSYLSNAGSNTGRRCAEAFHPQVALLG